MFSPKMYWGIRGDTPTFFSKIVLKKGTQIKSVNSYDVVPMEEYDD